jgi:hypothetical protein
MVSEDLIAVAEHDARAAAKAVAAMEWMARSGFSLDRPAEEGKRYWPVRPLGYWVVDDVLLVTAVSESRQRRGWRPGPAPLVVQQRPH